MTKIFNKFHKLYFLPIFCHFPHLLGKKIFSKIWLLCTATHWPIKPCQVSEKTNEPIPRKLPDGRTEGWKDRQTLIHRTLPATAAGLIKAPPYTEFPVSKENLYLFQIFHCIPCEVPFERSKNVGKKYLYKRCSSRHNKEQCNKRKEVNVFCGYCRYTFDIWHLFDISTKKPQISIKIIFRNNAFTM